MDREEYACPRCFENHRARSKGMVCSFCGTAGKPTSEIEGYLDTPKKHPEEECAFFETCDVQCCPLYFDVERMRSIEIDEKGCRARKKTREDIADRYGIASKGRLLSELTAEKRSVIAKARWEALPEEEKAQRRAMLKKHAFKKT